MADIWTILNNFSTETLLPGALDALLDLGIFALAFLIGILLAWAINKIIREAFKLGKLESWLKSKNLDKALLGVNPVKVINTLVGLFVVLIALGQGANLAGYGFFASTIANLLSYLVGFTEGLVIVAIALYAGTFIGNTIRNAQGILLANQLALGLQILVGYIALILALDRLLPGIDSSIFQEILLWVIGAIILTFALGVGLALGLGLKDSIAKAASKNQEAFDKIIGKIGK